MLTPAHVQSVVHDRIRVLLAERGGETPAVSGADRLNATLGLSSLDLALLVAELEAELGIDPFARAVPITSVRCVDDLVHAYQLTLSPGAEPKVAVNLAAAAKRAQVRRARREAI